MTDSGIGLCCRIFGVEGGMEMRDMIGWSGATDMWVFLGKELWCDCNWRLTWSYRKNKIRTAVKSVISQHAKGQDSSEQHAKGQDRYDIPIKGGGLPKRWRYGTIIIFGPRCDMIAFLYILCYSKYCDLILQYIRIYFSTILNFLYWESCSHLGAVRLPLTYFPVFTETQENDKVLSHLVKQYY